MTKTDLKKIQKVTEKLLKLADIKAEAEVVENNNIIDITLTTEESGILIGYHGETIESLQLVLSLCIAKELGSFQRISLEIGDYKKSRMSYLERLVAETKEKVITEHRPVTLSELKAWERRSVHLMLENDEDVSSESTGEGRDRVLTIMPKN